MSEKKLVKEWTSSAFDRTTNEWVHTTNQSYEHVEQVDEAKFITNAQPVKIPNIKRAKAFGEVTTRVFFGDTHFPFQDRRKIALANLAAKALNPVSITFLGDDLDNAMFSRFETRQEWASSTQRGIDELHQQLVIAKSITDDVYMHEGNHNIRPEREIRKYNGELLGLHRANESLGVLTTQFLLRLDEIGVEYIDGYPNDEKWYSDTLKSYHGVVTKSGGLALEKEIKLETVNFVHGHTHKAGIMYRQARVGQETRTIWGVEAGTFADQTLVPSGRYSTTNNAAKNQHHDWHTVLTVVRQYDGIEVPELIPITDDGVLINGKFYKS